MCARGQMDFAAHPYTLSDLLAPDNMYGIAQAAAILVDAIYSDRKIVIVGDFDADGATSTALCVRCLQDFGFKNIAYLVPNRFEFGYGLTPEIVAVAQQLHPDVIVTVDNGISSIDGVKYAKSLGVTVVVTDHHLPGRDLPGADAIVNPNQPECEFASKAMAGVGVAFYLMSVIRQHLKRKGWFAERNISIPSMAKYLDIVALGTVADVVPLDRNNRILVAQGLARIRSGNGSPGINALFKVARRNIQKLSASDLGFAAGPRLNAAGRLDDMSIGIKCLLASSDEEAVSLASQLDDLNRERRAIEKSMQVEANQILSEKNIDKWQDDFGLCLYQPDWHQGVIGILASRVKDKYHRPTIVFADAGDGLLKGSGRSIQGIHLKDVLELMAAQSPNLIEKFGGHAMAAGLTIQASLLDDFQRLFNQTIANFDSHLFEPIILSDGELSVEHMSLQMAQDIAAAGPWGQAFPEPQFDGVFHVVQQKLVGGHHLKMVLNPTITTTSLFDAIAFNVNVDEWPNQQVERVRVVYRLDINEYMDKFNLQLIIQYIEVES